jgi:16S rRNA processing protein RimM
MRQAPNCTSAVSSKSSSDLSLESNAKLHLVGWVKSAHALKGELYVQLHAESADWLSDVEWLSIGLVAESAKQWTIVRAKPFKQGLIVALDGLTDRTPAEALKGHKVWVDSSLLISSPGEPVFLNQLLNFRVFDKGHPIGIVVGFSTNTAQDLLNVDRGDGSVALVPLVDAYILSIDFDNQSIQLDLPEGLLQIEDR